MSVTVYYRYDDLDSDDLDKLVDEHCQVKIVCTNAPVGIGTDEEGLGFYPVAVFSVAGDKPVYGCEDCAEWLGEAFGKRPEYS